MRNEAFESLIGIIESIHPDNVKLSLLKQQLYAEYQRGFQVGDQDVQNSTIVALIPFAEYSTDNGQNQALAMAFNKSEGCQFDIQDDLKVLADSGMMDS